MGCRPGEWRLVAGAALLSRVLLVLFMLLGDAAFSDYDTSTSLVPECLRLHSLKRRSAAQAGNVPSKLAFMGSGADASDAPELGEEEEPRREGEVSGDWGQGDEEAGEEDEEEEKGEGAWEGSPFLRRLQPLAVWDAAFFVRIARCGYELEQWHAFMPGLPSLLRLSSPRQLWASQPLQASQNGAVLEAWLALTGLLLSNSAFVLAAIILHWLSLKALGPSSQLPLLAALLFCVSPASAFFSAIYAESLFALLSFGGMALWLRHHLRSSGSSMSPTREPTGAGPTHGDAVASKSQEPYPATPQRALSGLPLSSVPWELPASALLFALSSVVRSNGVLHSGFFLYSIISEGWPTSVPLMGGASVTTRAELDRAQPLQQQRQRQQAQGMVRKVFLVRTLKALLLLCCALLCFLPFITFQTVGYLSFCPSAVLPHSGAASSFNHLSAPSHQPHSCTTTSSSSSTPGAEECRQGLAWASSMAVPGQHNTSLALLATSWLAPLLPLAFSMPATRPGLSSGARSRPWCTSSVPYIYGFVQKEYWNVGFLRYFELKQAPNFLLAAPSLVLALLACGALAARRPGLLLSLGMAPSLWCSHDAPPPQRPAGAEPVGRVQAPAGKCEGGRAALTRPGRDALLLFSPCTLPFFVEMLVMACVCALVMHAQVSTRFLASCPALYWFSAFLLQEASRSARCSWQACIASWILTVSFLYSLAGSLAFVNFYPFT